MVTRLSGVQFIKDFCKSHGIPSGDVHTITIVAKVGDIVQIIIEQRADTRLEEIARLLATPKSELQNAK